jgi:hypothetical protein
MTDHRPLAWLRDHAKPSCRLARWLIKVREYDFVIKFIDGVRNTVADALSRYFLGENSPEASKEDDPGIVINQIGTMSARQRPAPKPPPKLDEEQDRDADIVQLFKWITKQDDPGAEPPENASRDLRHYHTNLAKFKLINNSVYREQMDAGHIFQA